MDAAVVREIFIGELHDESLKAVPQVRAVAGKGLEGDRHFQNPDKPSRKRGPDREVTLIEAEALEALQRDYDVTLAPAETRRNIVTAGVALNHLVGREFSVGAVMLRGIRLCEPCGHLEKLTRSGIQNGLRHRGGLRAQIVNDGIICVGDAIRPIARS